MNTRTNFVFATAIAGLTCLVFAFGCSQKNERRQRYERERDRIIRITGPSERFLDERIDELDNLEERHGKQEERHKKRY